VIASSPTRRSRVTSYSRNALKLGLFGLNLSSGRAATCVPERWSGSWDDNLRAALMADEAGLDFHLPVGRWKGWGGHTNFQGTGFESTAWACGLLAATKRITIFATVHAPLVHPVFAAKQFVTADHIGNGRFGLNIVCGWNVDEFDMFGAQQREHDERYAYGAEWIAAIYRMWEEPGSFDVDGTYVRLRGVEAEPKPVGGLRPIVMNAGTSEAGRAFAIANADLLFRNWRGAEENARDNADSLAAAKAAGREIGLYTSGYVICRPTRAEARAFEHYVVDENGDWEAIDRHIMLAGANNHLLHDMTPEMRHGLRKRFAAGAGGAPIVGDPDDVVAGLAQLHAAGFDGFAFSFVNYLEEFPYFRQEVLPRLERAGLRQRL